jgi:hypothetical protein
MIIEDGCDWLAYQVSWRGRDMVRLSGVGTMGERSGRFKIRNKLWDVRSFKLT